MCYKLLLNNIDDNNNLVNNYFDIHGDDKMHYQRCCLSKFLVNIVTIVHVQKTVITVTR